MGFFSWISGCSGGNGGGAASARYISEQSFNENLARQKTMSPQTVTQLRQYGVTDQSHLKLEFFFYTDTEAKARSLERALQQLAYDTESGPSAGDERLYLVTGWTTPLKMDNETVVAWTEQMCRLGFEHDAEFDGWGTDPDQ